MVILTLLIWRGGGDREKIYLVYLTEFQGLVLLGEIESSKSEKDKESALEMRRIAMETFGESKKRKSGKEEEKKKKCRNAGSDTIEYLREQNAEKKIREKELEMKERQ